MKCVDASAPTDTRTPMGFNLDIFLLLICKAELCFLPDVAKDATSSPVRDFTLRGARRWTVIYVLFHIFFILSTALLLIQNPTILYAPAIYQNPTCTLYLVKFYIFQTRFRQMLLQLRAILFQYHHQLFLR